MDKFTEIVYHRPDVSQWSESFQALLDQFDQADSAAVQETIIYKIDALRTENTTAGGLVYARHSIDTLDEFYKSEKEFWDNSSPTTNELVRKFYELLAASKYRKELEGVFGRHIFDLAEVMVRSFSAEVIEHAREDNKLSGDYKNLVARAEINFEGKVYNLAGLEPLEQSTNRDIRQAAVKAKHDWWQANGKAFDDLYDRLVKVRTDTAHKLGYENYVTLGYDRMRRTDYNASHVAAFRNQVIEYVVPLTVELREHQQKRLGLDKLRFHDLAFNFVSGNATPKGNTKWIIDNATKMYRELSPETGAFFDFMTKYELMDLENKKGKMAGGYCSYLPGYKAPFIFSNFNQTTHDIVVMTHEAGHAFQKYESRDQPLSEYLRPTSESAEIHSMSMEYLTWPWMNLFFEGDTDKFKYSHISSALNTISYCCAVDEYQHEVYAHPDMSPAQRDEVWRTLDKKYRPYMDYEGLPYWEAGGIWKRQMHIFCLPFYYIDYALAEICALQFWSRSQHQDPSAWTDYLTLCKAGGSLPFQKLVKLAGLKNPFEPGTVAPIANEVSAWLNNIDDSKL